MQSGADSIPQQWPLLGDKMTLISPDGSHERWHICEHSNSFFPATSRDIILIRRHIDTGDEEQLSGCAVHGV